MEHETAWLPQELQSVALRLARADHATYQLGELSLTWSREALQMQQADRGNGQLDVVVSGVRPIPPLASMLFSEAINHLRAAVDNTLFHLVESARDEMVPEKQAREIAMPIHEDPEKFTNWQSQKHSKGLVELGRGTALGDRIESLQPYADTTARGATLSPLLARLMDVPAEYAHPLVLLQKYSNTDKHRTIRTAGARSIVQRSDEPFSTSDRTMRPITVGDVLASTRRGNLVEISCHTAILVQRPDSDTWVSPASELDQIHRHIADIVLPTLVTGFALPNTLPPHIDLGDTGQTISERIRFGGSTPAHLRMAEVSQAALMESYATAPADLSASSGETPTG
ncbi:hypothetical protein W59_23740 [Rhodococcus opacus RKJ300 = JCM 13270]|uniref:Uncharacterized protein n=2 Tax=Rhodococcus TaxID=1827 RepID=I0WM00_RHOOP|nr:hypothetical protein W59_23740 [Rhodococcus opacus RKJ300 = JCM 13270]